MGKKLSITVIVLLYQLISLNYAQAGFYDWLVSKESANETLVHELISEPGSFDKIFNWNKRLLENGLLDQLITEPPKPEIKILQTYVVRATGYSSTPDQTDDTPFITAKGTRVRDGIIAANFHVNGRRVPFGTLVRIPAIYGDRVFVVEDRMNSRYTNNIDIWFPERDLALQFGSKKVTIEIVEES
ncbi:MAG: hypothetical protein A3B10_00360 [Candidatus Doudnabacteria bacterium RIFCSPLOWO2_01_FULL_44_21]|uniref:3D domain-containing protein n=1 Tax=Candidatus Doudnabacteria bacterium RIFCSPLOWO2_01_FULL_44_21 TaxID=1817841 RepID=A0A1F5PXD4_9BACT|nr:MAG: hypothetical protein A3B10_00360 [Candidatus Doudnabacteria bacterium RIFCSPLOWO2_01_FULL_44_21]